MKLEARKIMMKKARLHNLNSNVTEKYKVFICSASFESRCLAIPQKLKKQKFEKVIILENSEGSDTIKEHGNSIASTYLGVSSIIAVPFSDSLAVADRLAKELKSIKNRDAVLIDITTFTHENLLIFLKVLQNDKKVKRIQCAYLNASEYCPDSAIEKKWLSRGCGDIHSVLGFSGMILPSRKLHLIVIVGYEYDRAFEMISAIEPNSMTLIYGESNSALTDKDKEANQIFNSLVQQMTFEFSNVESIQVPCNDPQAVADALQKLYLEHSDDNVMVVPMNSKVSTVGVYLSMRDNDDVQICYAPAVVYNESNYSIPGKDCYLFDIK